MYAWLVSGMVRWGFRNLNRGSWHRPLRFLADDVHFVFHGEHEVACDLHRKADVEQWFARTWATFEMNFEIHDVVVRGWPRHTRVATRFTNRVKTRDGTEFVNQGTQYARVRWGRVVEDQLFQNSQLVARAIAHARTLQS